MKKLLAAVVACVFAFGSLSSFAATPASPVANQTAVHKKVVQKKTHKAKRSTVHHAKFTKKPAKQHARTTSHKA